MLAMNISKTKDKNKAVFVVLFGLGFLVLEGVIISTISHPSGFYTIIFGAFAAYCLDYFFWRPYIGYSTFYRARSIWPPLIVVLVLAVVLTLATVYGLKMQ